MILGRVSIKKGGKKAVLPLALIGAWLPLMVHRPLVKPAVSKGRVTATTRLSEPTV
jgi:hypothetical protein